MDRKKQMDKKNGLLDGYKKWMVGCMDRKKQMNG